MRKILFAVLAVLAVFAILPACVYAIPDISVDVDWSQTRATQLEAYEAGPRNYLVTCKNRGSVINLTGYTPVMWWATSNTAASVSTAACAIVSATGGTFRASFSASALNYSGGRYIYGIGLTSGTYSSVRLGTFLLHDDPYASGATPITWTSNINWALYTFLNTATNGPYRQGDGISFTTGAGGAVTIAATCGNSITAVSNIAVAAQADADAAQTTNAAQAVSIAANVANITAVSNLTVAAQADANAAQTTNAAQEISIAAAQADADAAQATNAAQTISISQLEAQTNYWNYVTNVIGGANVSVVNTNGAVYVAATGGSGTTNASGICADRTATNYAAAAGDVAAHLNGIDTTLGDISNDVYSVVALTNQGTSGMVLALDVDGATSNLYWKTDESGTTNANAIAANRTATNYTAAAGDVAAHLNGMDVRLAETRTKASAVNYNGNALQALDYYSMNTNAAHETAVSGKCITYILNGRIYEVYHSGSTVTTNYRILN